MGTAPTTALALIRSKKGTLSLRVTGDDGLSKILHSLYDPGKEARRLVDACSFRDGDLIVVLGLGLGYHVAALAERFPDSKIVVVEGMRGIFEAAIESGVLGDVADRVRFIVGLPPAEALQELTRYQIHCGMKPLSVFPLSPALSAFADYYEPISVALERATTAKLSERLKYPKFKREPVRVLLFDFDYFLTREVGRAVRSAGHRTSTFSVSEGERGEGIVSRLIGIILEFKPDFLLTINHLGFDEDGVLASFLEAIEMPVACWYVDSPNLVVKAFEKNVSSYILLFLWDKGYIPDMEAMGFEDVSYLPLGTDTGVFRPMPPSHPKIARCRTSVGFVGHSMVDRVQKWMSRLEGEVQPFVENLALEMLKTGLSFHALLEASEATIREMYDRLSARDRTNLEAAVFARSTLLYRLSCIQTLEPFEPRVYGDRAWRELLQDGFRLLPPVDYYKDLPLVYNACEINFNATNLQMGAAVNQRVFDVPACGAFVLTDHQEALGELFEIGREVVAFDHVEEIADLVRFYLSHPTERREVAARGRDRVLGEHTYVHRVARIIGRMRRRYG